MFERLRKFGVQAKAGGPEVYEVQCKGQGAEAKDDEMGQNIRYKTRGRGRRGAGRGYGSGWEMSGGR